MDTKDYIKLFEQSSELLVVIDTNFAIVAASDAFLKATTTVRENIVGRNAFDVFPDNPDDKTANGESIVRASFTRVIKNKTKDVLPIVKYDIPKSESEGGGYELKYWQATSSPILDENTNVKYIIHRTEDVTENRILITQLEFDKKALKLLEDSEKRYNMMLMQSPFPFAILKGKNKVITFANDKMKATWGKGNNIEGKPLIEVLPELKDTPFPALIDEVYKTGIPYYANEVLAPKYINGQKEDVYYNFVYQPYREVNETISGVTIIAAEVTAAVKLKKALEAQHEVEQKALKLVADSEKRYNMILVKSPFAFAILKGKDMVLAMANDSIKEMWGKGNEMEGKPLIEVLPELKGQGFTELLDKVYTTGIPYIANEALAKVKRNGKMEDVYFNFVYQPYRETDDTISGVTIIAIEVTNEVIAKQKIKDSQQQLQNIFMQAPFSLNIYEGKELVISLANKLFCEIIGKTESEILGKKLFDAFPETATQGLDKILSDIFSTGIPFRADEFPVHFLKHGNEFNGYFDFIYQPIFDYKKNVSGVINVAIDVTDKVLARKKIEESEQRFRLALVGSSQIVFSQDKNLKHTWIYNSHPDFKPEDVVGKSDNELHVPASARILTDIKQKVLNTGKAYNGEVEIELGGQIVNYAMHIETLKDAEENVTGIIGTAIDITKRIESDKKIKESERNLRQVLDSMPQKITNADTEGNVIYFNQKWLEDTGLKFEKLIGWGWEKVIHPDDVEATKTNWTNSFKTGDIFEMECRILNKEGEYKWHLSRALPISDENGKIKMWVGTNTDIHELKEAKSKAETATQIAEIAVKAKQQFLSNMSHEIRTPMNSIIGFTNVVLKTDLSEKQKEYINAIKVSGDALIVLINDILDIAKEDAGKMTFEQIPFDLSASISATLHLFEPKIQEKNLELIENYDAAIPEILLGDSVRLRQIVLNLLSNAVKFTNEGKITVSVRMLKEEADSIAIKFSVTDTGIGIPENKLEHIFDDFQQATNETSRLHGGTGLGLSIFKQFVELQGGTIHVESELGKGSTFGFILNFKKAMAEMLEITGTNNGVEVAERIENIRVLVAEDMPLNQLLIKIILKDFGFDVDIAGDGKIAIEKLQENKYDIILMDLQMPVLNGFEATEHIRSKMNSQIPIIALTADVTTVDVGKCEAVGMNDYISKPIDEKLLYSKIIKYLKKTN